MEPLTKKTLRRVRFQNLIDNAVSRGFASLIAILLLAAVVIVVLAAIAYLVLCKDTGIGPAEAVWTAFSFLTNPELPQFEDASHAVSYAIITFVIVVIGLLVTSALIGIITTALTNYYEGLRRGFSQVMSEGHIAILGFNDSVRSLVEEFRLAYGGKDRLCIVIVDDELSREEMERKIETFVNMKLSKLSDKENIEVVCRNGNLRSTDDLRRYNVHRSKSVIVNGSDDATTLKTLLAVSTLLRKEGLGDTSAPVVVCAFREKHFVRAAKQVGLGESLRVVALADTLSNLIAKTCNQPGLSKVFEEIFSYKGSEFYFVPSGELAGKNFDEAVAAFDRAIPIGICRPDAAAGCGVELIINVPDAQLDYNEEMTIRPHDELIVLAPDKRSAAEPAPAPKRGAAFIGASKSGEALGAEALGMECFKEDDDVVVRDSKKILVVGFDETFGRTALSLARYYGSLSSNGEVNCEIRLIYRNKRERRVLAARDSFLEEGGEFYGKGVEVEECGGVDSKGAPVHDILVNTTRISFECVMSDVIDLLTLEKVFKKRGPFNHVIVLSDLIMEREGADTETILTLLYLKAIAGKASAGREGAGGVAPFSITSEIQNVENIDLAYNEYVSDYIISWKLMASIQAQIADNRHLYKLIRDLLNQGGADIGLERASRFIDAERLAGGALVDFDALALYLRRNSDMRKKRVLVGYVCVGDGAHEGGHVLCPERDRDGRRLVCLGPDDMLVTIKTIELAWR